MGEKRNRIPTSTSNFGVGRRESHDSASFYARFVTPEITRDETVVRCEPEDPFICGDSSCMDKICDNSVALVVTSPPYFVGKEYEQALGEGHVPSSYIEYLEMLRRVFRECKRKLEPGGRIAVNVANLGRRPYRSLSSDVIDILQDDLGLLLRGEVIWRKAEGSSGSCAWGSFRQASNPVLRDVTERVIIASKGRFDRAIPPKKRQEKHLPYISTLRSDDFKEATLDVWDILPESATRVGHPAPFPVALPYRLIELYTYKDDLVLDPFMGSGSTLVAAALSSRRYAGYDLDPRYVEIARARVEAEASPAAQNEDRCCDSSIANAAIRYCEPAPEGEDPQARASREGKAAQDLAEDALVEAGFDIKAKNKQMPGLGLEVNFIASDHRGKPWYFDVSGAFTSHRGGLLRTDTLWKCLGRALVLTSNGKTPVVLLTTHLPRRKSAGDQALRAVDRDTIFDVIEMLTSQGRERLRRYATGEQQEPIPGFWPEGGDSR